VRIHMSSVLVDDQAKGLRFYTEKLGFLKKVDVPLGAYRWLTVVSRDEPEGTQLLLEPNENPAAKTFQQALYAQGIPLTAFAVTDVQQEFERLRGLDVAFRSGPTRMGEVTVAMLDDTCGNWIQLVQT
jgi:catechol 2,3-dioxygenase-like lactoylglutathione lyase family enzyme